MSCNRYGPHVYVLPEDDANRQLANGFLLDQSLSTKNIRVLGVAGGWMKVVERFLSDHVVEMGRLPHRSMVLLIDFDGDLERLSLVKDKIPGHLRDRVYVLGALKEPEDLKKDLGDYETIGLAMARDCHQDTDQIWGHHLLRHNAGELTRLRERVRSILFEPA